MGYGIYTLADNGSELIDGNYSGFALAASGTLYVAEKQSASDMCYTADIPLPSGYDASQVVVAIMPPLGEPVSAGGTGLITKNKINVPYRVFYPQKYLGPSSEEYGIRVWDEWGGLVFDSGNVSFNIVSSHTPNFIAPFKGSFTIDNTGNRWLVVGTDGLRHAAPGPSGNQDIGSFGYLIRWNGYVEAKVIESIYLPGGFAGDGSAMYVRQFSFMRVDIL